MYGGVGVGVDGCDKVTDGVRSELQAQGIDVRS